MPSATEITTVWRYRNFITITTYLLITTNVLKLNQIVHISHYFLCCIRTVFILGT